MSDISEKALDLLATVKKRGSKHDGMGTYFTDSTIAYWYHDDSDEDLLDSDDRLAIAELLDLKLAKYWDDNKDEYTLTPSGENYISTRRSAAPATVTNHFSGINNSTIANMSSSIHQNIDMSRYSIEIQKEVDGLREAVAAKDNTRAKRIIDGLWVSAPALILQFLQIGLGVSGGKY